MKVQLATYFLGFEDGEGNLVVYGEDGTYGQFGPPKTFHGYKDASAEVERLNRSNNRNLREPTPPKGWPIFKVYQMEFKRVRGK